MWIRPPSRSTSSLTIERPRPVPVRTTAERGVALEKGDEHPGAVAGRDARARVADAKVEGRFGQPRGVIDQLKPGAQLDKPHVGEFQRVRDQVVDDLEELHFVDEHVRLAARRQVEPRPQIDSPGRRCGDVKFDRRATDVGDVDGCELDAHRPVRKLGVVEDAVQDAQHACPAFRPLSIRTRSSVFTCAPTTSRATAVSLNCRRLRSVTLTENVKRSPTECVRFRRSHGNRSDLLGVS